MLNAHEFHDVIVMIEQVLDVGRLFWCNEIAHTGNSDHAAFLRHFSNRFVRFAAGMIRIERATIRMGNQHRHLRDLECIERGFVAAMRRVHCHAHFVHALDDADAEIADAFIVPFGAAVAD